MPDLRPGAIFAGHRIEGVAGRGGMGVVYRATHLALDHVVALKVISPELADDSRFRRRFESESRIAVSIRHPNVVAVHHAGEEDDLLFVTMDFVEGTDLRGLLNELGRLEPEQATGILDPVASALDAAHARGLVHRDIKPGNILIERRDGHEQVYLTDFGLTKRIEAESGVTATGAFVGTLDYVAPEQIKGERVDARSDVYSLGCVLFETLAGEAPFAARGDKVAKMYAHLQDEPPLLRQFAPEVPRELDGVVRRALEKDPERRFPSAGDLARAAGAALEGRPTVEAERSVATGAAAPVPDAETAEAAETREPALEPTAEAGPPTAPARPPTAPPPAPRRSPWPLVGALAAIAAIGAVAFVALSGDDDGAGGGGGGGDGAGDGAARVVGAPIRVPEMPVGIFVGEQSVWVGSRRAGTVTQLDPNGGQSGEPVELGGSPEGVAVGERAVWVADGAGDDLLRLEPGTGEVTPIHVGLRPGGVAIGEGRVWVAASENRNVTAVDPKDFTVQKITVGDFPYGVAVGEGAVWVSNREEAAVSRIDPATGEVIVREIPVGGQPKGIAVAEGSVWVANTADGTVSRIDPGRNSAVDTIEVGAEPRDVAFGAESLWVTNGGDDSVSQIDPGSGSQVDEIELAPGAAPEDIAFGLGHVWVTNGGDDTVTRIEP